MKRALPYSSAMRSAPLLRVAALVLTAALALHELRYAVAGRPAGDAVGSGHGYLPLVGLAASILLGAAVAMLARALARARRTGSPGERPFSFSRAWVLGTGALLALHLGQELLEATLSATGPGALVANGALLVAPLAVVLGALVALGLRGAREALAAAARTAPACRPLGPAPYASKPRTVPARRQASPLALHLSQRAPPLGA